MTASESFAVAPIRNFRTPVAKPGAAELATQLSNVTVHDLYAHYPDFLLISP